MHPMKRISYGFRPLSHLIHRTYAEKIAVGISGGIDSSVTALTMKKKGYDVIGVHMQNWDLEGDETLHEKDQRGENTLPCYEKDEKDARKVCDIIGIPFQKVSFSNEYWMDVWERVIKEYQFGITPNPDVLCNRYIKAAVLPDYIEKHFGIHKVATGHYARKLLIQDDDNTIRYSLLSGVDKKKDQAYFLSQITQDQLQKMEFPLGDLTKEQVKEIARDEGLEFLLDKRESMGVCFIGKRRGKFKEFLSQYITPTPGTILFNNKIIGNHDGLHTMTIGERARIGGCKEK